MLKQEIGNWLIWFTVTNILMFTWDTQPWRNHRAQCLPTLIARMDFTEASYYRFEITWEKAYIFTFTYGAP